MSLPEAGKFKIQTVGPQKDIPNKKDPNRPWKTFSLQFEGDNNWYDTFWVRPTAPEEGEEISGTKVEDEKFGLKFEVERQGGKSQWNPAAAQATIVLAAAEVTHGFLSLGDNYALWTKNDEEVKKNFAKYINTVDSVAKQLKDKVVGMGSIKPEEKVSETTSPASNDPGPGTPPPIEGWPEDEEEVNV